MTHRHLLLLVVFAAIFTFDLARETDMDFWWHVRTGQLIAETVENPADVADEIRHLFEALGS